MDYIRRMYNVQAKRGVPTGRGAAMTDCERGVITREEWTRRYAARIMERACWPEHAAMEAARIGAEEYERGERVAGNVVVWSGIATGCFSSPEECADEEMSYWDDDGL